MAKEKDLRKLKTEKLSDKEEIIRKLTDPKATWDWMYERAVLNGETICTMEYIEDNNLQKYVPSRFDKEKKHDRSNLGR